MSKDNNVIKFPVEKAQQRDNSEKKVRFDLENKRIMISASMVSFLFLVSLINSSILSTNTQSVDQSRGIASINGLNRNTTWEHALAKEMAQRPVRRGLASLGTAPSNEERLIIGLLQSQYQVKYANGHIKEVHFDSAQAGVEPKEINPEEFIAEFREIFPVEFSQAQRREILEKEGKQLRRYALLDSAAQDKAELLFELDQKGRMLSLKVESKSLN